MSTKKITLLLLVLMLSGMLLPVAYSLGIGFKKRIEFLDLVPGNYVELDYVLTHTRKTSMDYFIHLLDDGSGLNRFFRVEPSNLTALEHDHSFKVIFNVPKDVDLSRYEPGIHTLWLVAEEVFSSMSGIGARGVVKLPIRIRVLYDYAVIKASISVKNGNVNDLLPVKLSLENWGKENTVVNGFVNVLDSQQKIQRTLTFDPIEVKATERKEVNLVLDTTGFLQGEYTAVAEIYWNENKNKTIASTTFLVGNLDLKIKNYTKELKADEINPFEITVESLWNNPMEDVYARVLLKGPDGKEFSMKTPTYTLDPWKELTLKGYVDLTGAPTGKYKGKIVIYFDGKSKEKSIKVDVVSKEAVEMPGATPAFGLSKSVFIGLLIAIIALIELNIFIIFYFMRKNKRKKSKK